jgi:hypothetical protein
MKATQKKKFADEGSPSIGDDGNIGSRSSDRSCRRR